MRRPIIAIWVLLSAVPAWWLLGTWVPGESERFYLLVPPVALGLSLALSGDSRAGWRKRFRSTCIYLGGLTIVCVCYSLSLSGALTPFDPARMLRGINLRETALAVYFLAGMTLLIEGFRSGVRGLVRRCEARLCGAANGSSPRRRGVALAGDCLVPILVAPVVLAYIVGVLYVHRFKVPNAASPQSAAGRSYADVQFVTADALTIRGWFIPARSGPAERTLLICHGLGANRSVFLPYLKVGDTLDANVLMFDFRGHGDSDGHTVTLGYRERLDVLAAVEYLRSERPAQSRQVIGLGISMGSSALVLAASEVEPPLDGVIIDSGFACAGDLADKVLQNFPGWLRPCVTGPGIPLASLHAGCRLSQIRPEDRIGLLHAPVLIIHARGDTLIPAAHAVRLYEHAREPKRLWVAPTEGHGSPLFRAEDDYLEAVRRFANERAAIGLPGTITGAVVRRKLSWSSSAATATERQTSLLLGGLSLRSWRLGVKLLWRAPALRGFPGRGMIHLVLSRRAAAGWGHRAAAPERQQGSQWVQKQRGKLRR